MLCCAALALAGCSDENDPEPYVKGPFTVPDGGQLEQTFSADDSEGGVTFTCTADWTASVTETKSVSWITVSPDHGGPGTYTLKITLLPNDTGSDRSATVTITSGATVIAVTVTQGAENGGVTPPEPTGMKYVRRIVHTVWNEIDYPEQPGKAESERSDITALLTYDAQGRLTEVLVTEPDGDYEMRGTTSLRWLDGAVEITLRFEERYGSEVASYMLNLDSYGYVASWTGEEDGEREEGTLHYDNGYLSRADHGGEWPWTSRTTWTGGDLTEVVDSEGTDYRTTAEYGSIANNPNINLDLNYIISQTEWYSCLGFDSNLWAQPIGLTGKRSAHYMTRETDHYVTSSLDARTFVHEYETNAQGLVTKVTSTGYDIDGEPYYDYPEIFSFTYTDGPQDDVPAAD